MQYVVDSSRPQSTTPRKRGPSTALRIDTPLHNHSVALVFANSSASTLSSAASEPDPEFLPFSHQNKPRSLRNMKKLSLTLPSAHSNASTNSLSIPNCESPTAIHPAPPVFPPATAADPRRASIVSLPSASASTMSNFLHRKDEDGSPSAPYLDGPLQITPGIWLGSEDNARDWKGLVERGIKAILNVAKEVPSPFDTAANVQPLRPVSSTPNLAEKAKDQTSTYHPAHASGRPALHYLKLPWSHGQSDLVKEGFVAGMAFVDDALNRGDGVLIHCQCGISRSATMVIALVMRAASLSLPSVPPDVWELKDGGMQAAYAFVKQKSKWVGPNMSLIYQLMDYERALKGKSSSYSSSAPSSAVTEDEEWGRRRALLDETPPDSEYEDRDGEFMREARELDQAMEDRLILRKGLATAVPSGMGMGAAWKSRYMGRERTGSLTSNRSNQSNSVLSEDLVEEDEEQELLGVGGGFDHPSTDSGSIETRSPSMEVPEDDSPPWKTRESSQQQDISSTASPSMFTPLTARPRPIRKVPLPTAPAWKTSFNLVPPPTAPAMKASFNLPSRPNARAPKRRPPPLIDILPPVPSSPIVPVTAAAANVPAPPNPPPRAQSRRAAPPPLSLRHSSNSSVSSSSVSSTRSNSNNSIPFPSKLTIPTPSSLTTTPSQTLFVFPPSPTLTTGTPSTMTLQSLAFPFPTSSTPRVSTFRSQGKRKSYIGLGTPVTPTTACSRVDARGYVVGSTAS